MITNDDEKELLDFLCERRKWKTALSLLRRKHVYIPLVIICVYLIDNPDIHVVQWLLGIVKKITKIG